MFIIGTALAAFLIWGLTFGYWLANRRHRQLRQAEQQRQADQQDTAVPQPPQPPAATAPEPFVPSRAQVRRLSALLDQMEGSLRQANRQQQNDLAPTALNLLATIGSPVTREQLPQRVQEQFDRLDSLLHGMFADFDQRMERVIRETGIPHPSQRGVTSTWSISTTSTTSRARPPAPAPAAAPAAPAAPRPRQEARPRAAASSEPTVPNRPRPTVWQRLRDPWPTTTETPQTTSPNPQETAPPKKTP